jgi:hypothetical protein
MERDPFSYTGASLVEADLRSAGFRYVTIDTTTLMTHVNARDAAAGMVLGSPIRAEIERRDPTSLERAVDAVTAALACLDGQEAPISAHVVIARR